MPSVDPVSYGHLPEVPVEGGERELLFAFVDYQRSVVRRKAEKLTASQLNTRLRCHPSPLTIGGIIQHLCWVEYKWAQSVFLGVDNALSDERWGDICRLDPDRQWDAWGWEVSGLVELFDRSTEAARAAYAGSSLDAVSERSGFPDPDEDESASAPRHQLRWILLHLLEEYSRHAGHLDLLREEIDGSTGD